MGLEEIVPAIFLIAVLVLVLPAFLRSNSKLKQKFLCILTKNRKICLKNLEKLKMKNQIQVSKSSFKRQKVSGRISKWD